MYGSVAFLIKVGLYLNIHRQGEASHPCFKMYFITDHDVLKGFPPGYLSLSDTARIAYPHLLKTIYGDRY